LETALQNAFKAIEAVIGDPPKDYRKLERKLKEHDLEFDEKVGYGSKKSLGQVIRDMNKLRDKKSAHGITSPRAIKILDMLEYQACARHIVMSALENAVSEY